MLGSRGCRSPRLIWTAAAVLLIVSATSVLWIWTEEPVATTIDAIKALKVSAAKQPGLRIPSDTSKIMTALVIPKTRHDDVQWLSNSDIQKKFVPFVYTTDRNPESQYLKPHTRAGREAAAYLSYIVDYYDSLPQYSLFIHAAEDQWHNDVFSKSTNQPDTLQAFRTASLDAYGYVNLRCKRNPGCPKAMNIFDIPAEDVPSERIKLEFTEMYREVFDVGKAADVPKEIGNVCCAQFGVSRERILRREKVEYERMLEWANTTTWDGFEVGWLFEKVWHIVFGMDAVLCPEFDQCRCDNFGWCGPLANGKVLRPATATSPQL